MPVFLLIPLETSQPKWESSWFTQPVQVIASSEEQARLRARSLYSTSDASNDPWMDPRLVYAHPVDEADRRFPTLTAPPGDQPASRRRMPWRIG
jgi:hypothetical protein